MILLILNEHRYYPMNEAAPDLSHEQSCVVRRAMPADAPAIERLYRELVSDPLVCVLPEQIATIAALPNSFLLVAEVFGAVHGTALFTVCLDAMYRSQPFGVVENVVVAQARRGGGIGGRLLAQVEHLASIHHCTKMMLLSSLNREAAHAFFRHCGFQGDTKYAFVKYRRQFSATHHR